MKKYLFLAMALLGLASCTKDDIANGNNPIHSGEVETSYIAINLNAADNNTRADDGYQEGLEAERAVKAAYFFFFDDAGNAFPVTANPGNPATGEGATDGVNWISANLNNVGENMPNVSDIKDAVLVLSTYKGQYPSQIVAVINWAPTAGTQYKLEDLYAATAIQGTFKNAADVDTNYFVMSNAVYAQGTKAVVGAPLTQANIHKSPADALANPIKIHVERIAAKVTVTAKDGVENNRFKIQKKTTGNAVLIPLGGNDTEVYVQVTGWELHNDFTQSKLLKEINPEWTNLGFTWNDPDYFRCYWATSLTGWAEGENAFPTNFSLGMGKTSDVNNGTYIANTYTYVGENTLYDAVNKNADNCTKVIIKAKLQKKKDDGTFDDLKLARWYATYYAGVEDLLTAVANTVKYQYYWLDSVSKEYVYIGPEDLTVKKVDNWVIFQLSDEGMGKNWYIRNGDKYTNKTKDEINALLATIEKGLYYDNAETLYYVDIAHLGNGEGKPGDYGVVRNHIYNVVLNSFGGLGSPVYVPGGNLVYPNDPLDTGEYVSAEVRVLSWRLVSQEVDIQPNN